VPARLQRSELAVEGAPAPGELAECPGLGRLGLAELLAAGVEIRKRGLQLVTVHKRCAEIRQRDVVVSRY